MSRRRGRRFGSLVGLGLLAAAVFRERRMPPEERTGQGKVGGLVPYDLRRPTLGRYRQALWSPDEPMFGPSPFGVGWTFNAGRLVRNLRG